MWQRLGDDEQLYRKEDPFYFRLTLDIWKLNPIPWLLYYSYAFDVMNGIDILDAEDWLSDAELNKRCEKTRRRVEDCSAGMLEVYEIKDLPVAHVRFIHRTAADFLEDTEEGQRLLSFHGSDRVHRNTALLRARLLVLRLGPNFSGGILNTSSTWSTEPLSFGRSKKTARRISGPGGIS